MYLYRYPRYKNYRPEDIDAVQDYMEYMNNPELQWCRFDGTPSEEDVDYLKRFMTTRYWAWDTKHEYPHDMISEQVAYWRKANAIHKWFVDNIQDGEDDCCYHREVTERDLEKLIGICKEILDTAVLTGDKNTNDCRYQNGKEELNLQDDKYFINVEVCKKLLPSESGFFFGSTDYDQWYVMDIKETYEVLKKVLKETDFETQMLFYVSSW